MIEYAVTIHEIVPRDAPGKLRAISGNATLTIDMSRVATKDVTAHTAKVGHGLGAIDGVSLDAATSVRVDEAPRSDPLVSSVTERTVHDTSSTNEPTTLGAMSRTDTSQWPCTIARAADLLGDGWNLLIVRQACLGARRFEEFHDGLGIGRGVLTSHLGTLVEAGVFDRVPYQDRPERFEYRLTDKGRDIFPVLAAMAAWAERWMTGPEGTPLVFHHRTCEHDMRAEVVCSECAAPLSVRDVSAGPGPGHPSRVGSD